jgi:hypothetical protein
MSFSLETLKFIIPFQFTVDASLIEVDNFEEVYKYFYTSYNTLLAPINDCFQCEFNSEIITFPTGL